MREVLLFAGILMMAISAIGLTAVGIHCLAKLLVSLVIRFRHRPPQDGSCPPGCDCLPCVTPVLECCDLADDEDNEWFDDEFKALMVPLCGEYPFNGSFESHRGWQALAEAAQIPPEDDE